MARNQRIFYACQAVAIAPREGEVVICMQTILSKVYKVWV